MFEVFAVWASDVGRGGGGLSLVGCGHVTRVCAVVGGRLSDARNVAGYQFSPRVAGTITS